MIGCDFHPKHCGFADAMLFCFFFFYIFFNVLISIGITSFFYLLQADFRISATGSVLDLDKSIQLMKKLKLTGTPLKIFKNTAFIKVMMHNRISFSQRDLHGCMWRYAVNCNCQPSY